MIPAGELFDRIVAHVTRRTRFFGLYPYQVTGGTAGRPSLEAVGAVPGLPRTLPDAPYLDQAHGLPGASSVVVIGTIALVGFKGGDGGAPYVALYLPGQPLPTSVTLDASTLIKLGGGASSYVALATLVAVELLQIQTTLAAILALLQPPPPAMPGTPVVTVAPGTIPTYTAGSTAASKVKAQ